MSYCPTVCFCGNVFTVPLPGANHTENNSCNTFSIVACAYSGRCLEMGLHVHYYHAGILFLVKPLLRRIIYRHVRNLLPSRVSVSTYNYSYSVRAKLGWQKAKILMSGSESWRIWANYKAHRCWPTYTRGKWQVEVNLHVKTQCSGLQHRLLRLKSTDDSEKRGDFYLNKWPPNIENWLCNSDVLISAYVNTVNLDNPD
jgi:hypothetical protein